MQPSSREMLYFLSSALKLQTMKSLFPIAMALALPGLAYAENLPSIQTVFVILEENENWADMKGSTSAPYLNNTLLPMASHCEQYYNPPGLHPSLPNYLWLEAGTNFGINNDSLVAQDHQSTTNHLVTLLNNAGISWRTYQEDISAVYVPLTNTNNYVARHNPFVYFDDVTGTNNSNYAYGIAHIRPYQELAADLTNNTVARYNFITPNLFDDGHTAEPPQNNEINQIDNWLASEIPKILNSSAYSNNGAIFITWDEGEGSDGPIGMIVLSPLARGGGYFNNNHYTHSSALRTFQEIFGVTPFLGDAANATDLSDLFTKFSNIAAAYLPDGQFQMTFAGVIPGKTNILQASTDLSAWISVSTNVSSTNTLTVLDSKAINFTHRYYRLAQLP
jgi:phosphatidylinositol-3-phosphatase